MTKHAMGWILAGLSFVAATPFVASGCSHSLEGDYIRLCRSSCETNDACENITKFAVDLDKCYRDCDNNADNFAAAVEDKCGQDYEILGENVDRCDDSLNKLEDVCRNDHKSEVNDAANAVADDCGDTYVRCR